MASDNVKTLQAQLDIVRGEILELEEKVGEKKFSEAEKEQWNRLNKTVDEYEERIERQIRRERVDKLRNVETNVERVDDFGDFQVRKPGSYDDPYDLSEIERDYSDPSKEGRQLKDRAKAAIERAQFPHTDKETAQGHAERLLEEQDSEQGSLARHMLVTGSPEYKRAFGKYLKQTYLTPGEGRALEMSRALSLTGTSGGFAVPFELDPTVIPTSNLAINPFRALARVEQITVDEWRGVSSGAVTAYYGAEAVATTTDSSPTLAQPTISTEKAQSFIPFSIEIGMDWNGLATEMGRLLQDAKDVLEATMFATGSGSNQPQGIITGATTVYTAAATSAITIADLYGWEIALPARFRPNAAFAVNGATVQKIRAFDTAGGAQLWIDNLQLGQLTNQVPTPGQMQYNLLGHPMYEATGISGTYTTGQLIGVFGDWSYYVIVDRIGLTVETIPHLFDVTNNYPTGQRGLYAYWRNSAEVIDPGAFRVLKLA